MVFLHPVHNYALITYDPSALGVVGASAVRAAELLPGMFLFLEIPNFIYISVLTILDSG